MTWKWDILEVASMVVTWWIVAFLRNASRQLMCGLNTYSAHYLIQPDSHLPQGHLVMFQRATLQGQTGLELELFCEATKVSFCQDFVLEDFDAEFSCQCMLHLTLKVLNF